MLDPRRTFAVVALVSATACKEPPSFVMRWSLDGETLEQPVQCAERGVFAVAALTYDAFDRPVDIKRLPCFAPGFADPDATADGPRLPEGVYAVRLVGTTRGYAVWNDPATLEQEIFAADIEGKDYLQDAEFERCRALAEDPACRPEELACDCKRVEVVEDQTVRIPTFDLGRPPQCADGIDNDRDGLVDEGDPACGPMFSLATLEGRSVSASEFDVRVSFFDHNPAVGCSELGVSRLEVVLADEVVASSNDCDDSLRFSAILDESVADGPAVDDALPITLQVRALDFAGEPIAEPVLLPLSVPLDVGGFFVLQADFAADRFFEPIVAPARFTVGFVPYEDAPHRGCDPLGSDELLAIDTVRITWLDAHGRPLDPPIVLADGTALDGSPRACPGGTLTTPPLPWGDYLVRLEGLSAAGEVCFSNADAPSRAAPSEKFGVLAPRVSATGSCRDCATDDECGPSRACVEGVCRTP